MFLFLKKKKNQVRTFLTHPEKKAHLSQLPMQTSYLPREAGESSQP